MIKSCKIGGIDIIDLVIDIQGLKTKEESRDLESLFITIKHDDENNLDLFKSLLFKNYENNDHSFELSNWDKFGNFIYRFIGEIKIKDLTLLNIKNHLNKNNESTKYLLHFEYGKMLMTNKQE